MGKDAIVATVFYLLMFLFILWFGWFIFNFGGIQMPEYDEQEQLYRSRVVGGW